MHSWRLISLAFLGLSLLYSFNSVADSIPSTKTTYIISKLTPESFTKLSIDQQQDIAAQWHLSAEDYSHYLYLMNQTVNNVYYKDKNLDPTWILGFNAKDAKEREKFVMLAIQNERLRVAKELAFQQDFDRLQREMYPDLAPILWKP